MPMIIDFLKKHGSAKVWDADVRLINAGNRQNTTYYIEEGTLQIENPKGEFEKLVTAPLWVGDHHIFTDDELPVVNVTTITAARGYTIPSAALADLIRNQEHFHVFLDIFAGLAQRAQPRQFESAMRQSIEIARQMATLININAET